MCDTLAIVANWREDNTTYFAKNSDRSANEPHLILRVPGGYHEPDSLVRCTYISIPQVEYTRETILYKPSWIWGAEMGINENRVVIGNEAVFTKAKKGDPSLIGMDILRLALERADTATSAVEVMISLLETYGQGGNCGYDKEFYYDNSFLAADPREAYVLETSGKKYAVLKIEDKYAISNRLSIGRNHYEQGGVKPGEDFAKRYTEPVYSHFSAAKQRRSQAMEGLCPTTGAAQLMEKLRTHEKGFAGHEFERGSVASVCMHAGGLVGDQTTGSMIAVLRPSKPVTLWSTGCSTPCISAFKPVFWNSDSPPVFTDPASSLDYWLKREHIHRAIIAGKIDAHALRDRIHELEADWLRQEEQIMNTDTVDDTELIELSATANKQEQALIDEFYVQDWQNIPGRNRYARYWKHKNEKLLDRGQDKGTVHLS
ncbi:MAG: hypothetical protein FWE83_06595 [Oscillospiraceae bacterium]|nr:hypothetical protein [Oscillospiraceae bacterium]